MATPNDNSVRYYRFKDPCFDKYIMSKDGTVINAATKQIIPYNKENPSVIELEVNGQLVAYTGSQLLAILDDSIGFRPVFHSGPKVTCYIVHDMQDKRTSVLHCPDVISNLFPQIDMEELNEHVMAGYTYNFGDRWLIYTNAKGVKPSVSFSLSTTDIVKIYDPENKRIRHIRGANLLKDDPMIVLPDNVELEPSKPDKPNMPNAGQLSKPGTAPTDNIGENMYNYHLVPGNNVFKPQLEMLGGTKPHHHHPTDKIVDATHRPVNNKQHEHYCKLKEEDAKSKREQFFNCTVTDANGDAITI